MAEFSLRSVLKNIFVEWFLASTAHALPNIFRTSSIFLKIIWICCFIASSTYCIYSISLSLKEYLTYPTHVSTQLIQEIPTQFPAVTVCNLKKVKKDRAQFYVDKYLSAIKPDDISFPFIYVSSMNYLIQTLLNYDTSLNESNLHEIGYELKSMLYGCFFNYKPCSLSDFTHRFDTQLGNCYTFNSGQQDKIKTVSVPGKTFGLSFELFLGLPNNETKYEYSDGLLVSIHNSTNAPFSEDGGITVAAGADTDIMINRNFVSKLDHPYGNCLKDTSKKSKFSSYFFDHIVRTLDVTYTSQQCFALCLQEEIIIECNCLNTFIASINQSYHFCFEQFELECAMNVVNTFGERSTTVEKCTKSCPSSCDYIDYQSQVVSSLYPTVYYKSLLAETEIIKSSGINYDDIDKAVAKVNVYYKTMSYTIIEERISTTTEAFFSNIGGTLGLYLGISILSTVELVELLYNLIYFLYNCKKAQNKTNNEESKVTN